VLRDSVQAAADSCTETSKFAYWKIYDLDLEIYDRDNGGTMGNFGISSDSGRLCD
jgi:hypothetical protein